MSSSFIVELRKELANPTEGWELTPPPCAGPDGPVAEFGPSEGNLAAIEAAKAVCEGCEVKAQCLAAEFIAIDSASSIATIRAGLGFDEQRKLFVDLQHEGAL